MNADQFNDLKADLRDIRATAKANEAQLVAVIRQQQQVIADLKEVNARISFERRLKT